MDRTKMVRELSPTSGQTPGMFSQVIFITVLVIVFSVSRAVHQLGTVAVSPGARRQTGLPSSVDSPAGEELFAQRETSGARGPGEHPCPGSQWPGGRGRPLARGQIQAGLARAVVRLQRGVEVPGEERCGGDAVRTGGGGRDTARSV